MKYQLLQMEKNGGGTIANNSSILSAVGFANSAAYVASKHGIIGLTQTTGLEYGTKGIRVNAIGPAFINTPLLTEAGMTDEVKHDVLVPLHPIGRLGESKEVAELVVWLSFGKASFVIGSFMQLTAAISQNKIYFPLLISISPLCRELLLITPSRDNLFLPAAFTSG